MSVHAATRGSHRVEAYRDGAEHLADELRRLDLRIGLLLESARLHNQDHPRQQASRTVYITREEVDWLLAEEAVDRAAGHDGGSAALDRLGAEIDARVRSGLADGVPLALPSLARLFGLTAAETQAVVVCLAPELRRKYDRLYAYLQDDITRKRPSVDLVLELLYPGAERLRWAARGLFAESAPLLRHGILRTVEDPQSPSGSSGLARFLALDQRICQYVLGAEAVDVRLNGLARVEPPRADGPFNASGGAVAAGLARLARHHLGEEPFARRTLVCQLHGPPGAGRREAVRETCDRLGLPLLSLDAAALARSPAGLAGAAFREGLLRRAAVHLYGADVLLAEDAGALLGEVGAAVADFGRLVFLTGEAEWSAGGAAFPGAASPGTVFPEAVFQPVRVPAPDVPGSTACWERALAPHTAEHAGWAAELAALFRMPPDAIAAAVALAENDRLMEAAPRPLALADVAAACRRQTRSALGGLAVLRGPVSGWDDLVLPPDTMRQLREIGGQVRHRHRVFGAWGFGTRIGHGTGLSALFSGPPGTGKTLAAEVLAGDLGLDLFTVDLSGVVSKYVGETEKNLSRIFERAGAGNAILFFDEADALFGKRTEVSDAHDRYANIETSYLLQKMEEYEGAVILATNLRQNMDEAFTRRLRFIVEFPFPGVESRERIWRTLIPYSAPLAGDVDFRFLAREFPLSGGSIKNVVLNAAFLAAGDGGVLTRRHVLAGTRREFAKIGKLWTEPEADSRIGGGAG
ncbi:ATP-binding protein [Streptomyces sp. ODS28]|uniref:ATP-binding protein n=1 Tax=Streptomyces sp. ODS28 TaxID=3136688 RepID=UPI0031E68297